MRNKSAFEISRRDFIKTSGASVLSVVPFFPLSEMAQGVDQAAIQKLQKQVRGELLRPSDGGYDAARRVWNGMVNKHPAFIVRCAGAADVIDSVNFARTNNLPISVRGGGHNVAGSAVCDGGIMLDLSRMKSIRVDSVSRTARAEPGVIWAEFDHETQAFGLATTGGTCSQTGIAGVTLGGGEGWLMRKYGLTMDNLLSVDLVTADGKLRKADASENTDLFFGVRGAQSNFGVATSLEYRLHPVSTVLAGVVLQPLERAKDVLKLYSEFNREAPEEMSAWAYLMTSSDGRSVVAVAVCYIGSVEQGEKVVRPLKKFGPPMADMIQPMPYLKAQSMGAGTFPPGRLNYWKSNMLREFSEDAMDRLIGSFRQVTSRDSMVLISQLGGAVKSLGKDGTAVNFRTSLYNLVIMSEWSSSSESEKHIRWTDELWNAMQPFSSGGVSVNALGNEGEERVKAAYGTNYERLVSLKSKYDPTNLFRFNQNIRPTFRKGS
jgi:FAD/FMN-containing dehydrogenase